MSRDRSPVILTREDAEGSPDAERPAGQRERTWQHADVPSATQASGVASTVYARRVLVRPFRGASQTAENRVKFTKNRVKLSRNPLKFSGNRVKFCRSPLKFSGNPLKFCRYPLKFCRYRVKFCRNPLKFTQFSVKFSGNPVKFTRNPVKFSRQRGTATGERAFVIYESAPEDQARAPGTGEQAALPGPDVRRVGWRTGWCHPPAQVPPSRSG